MLHCAQYWFTPHCSRPFAPRNERDYVCSSCSCCFGITASRATRGCRGCAGLRWCYQWAGAITQKQAGAANAKNWHAVRFVPWFHATSILIYDVIFLHSGLAAAGYTSSDASSLADATMVQQRLLNNMPTMFERHGIEQVFQEAMSYW